MSWMDKLRAELIDIVEWIDDSEHTLVWRFPRYQNEIKYGAQLIVRPGQEAIFVRSRPAAATRIASVEVSAKEPGTVPMKASIQVTP